MIRAPRVVLTPATPEWLAGMPWLEAALAPEWTLADLAAAVAAGNGVLISDRQGTGIGIAVALPDTPEAGSATVPFLGVDPERRFRGLGGEAGLALSAELGSRGATKVYAPVPDGRGLAVYFWLRLGFRPLTTADSPGPLIGLSTRAAHGIWMLSEAP